MKKIMKFLFALAIVITATFSVMKAMEVTRKLTGHFRFEDYSTAEGAQSTLQKLHPVGSNVDDLITTLNKAGSTTRFLEEREFHKEWKKRNVKEVLISNFFQKKILTWKYLVYINLFRPGGKNTKHQGQQAV